MVLFQLDNNVTKNLGFDIKFVEFLINSIIKPPKKYETQDKQENSDKVLSEINKELDILNLKYKNNNAKVLDNNQVFYNKVFEDKLIEDIFDLPKLIF